MCWEWAEIIRVRTYFVTEQHRVYQCFRDAYWNVLKTIHNICIYILLTTCCNVCYNWDPCVFNSPVPFLPYSTYGNVLSVNRESATLILLWEMCVCVCVCVYTYTHTLIHTLSWLLPIHNWLWTLWVHTLFDQHDFHSHMPELWFFTDCLIEVLNLF